jgi:hypothetical protein
VVLAIHFDHDDWKLIKTRALAPMDSLMRSPTARIRQRGVVDGEYAEQRE